jgi:hypothetical protein
LVLTNVNLNNNPNNIAGRNCVSMQHVWHYSIELDLRRLFPSWRT